jgi:hypothetical protein
VQRLEDDVSSMLDDSRARLRWIELSVMPEGSVEQLEDYVARDAAARMTRLEGAQATLAQTLYVVQAAKEPTAAKTAQLMTAPGAHDDTVPSVAALQQLSSFLDPRARMMVIRLAFAEVRRDPKTFFELCEGRAAVLPDDYAQLEMLRSGETDGPLQELQLDFDTHKMIHQQMMDQAYAKSAELQQQLLEVRKQQQREATLLEVQNIVTNLRQQVAQANGKLAQLRDEIAEVRDDLAFADRDREMLGDKLDASEARIASLQRDLLAAREGAHSSQEVQGLQDRIDESASELEQMQAQRDALEIERDQAVKDKAALLGQFSAERVAAEQVSESLTSVTAARDDMARRQAGLAAEVRDLKSRLERCELEKETLSHLQEASNTTLQSLRTAMQTMARQHRESIGLAAVQHKAETDRLAQEHKAETGRKAVDQKAALDRLAEQHKAEADRLADRTAAKHQAEVDQHGVLVSATAGVSPPADGWSCIARDLAQSEMQPAARGPMRAWQPKMVGVGGTLEDTAVQLAAGGSDLHDLLTQLVGHLCSAPAARPAFVARVLESAIARVTTLECRIAAAQAVALLEQRWSVNVPRTALEADSPISSALFVLDSEAMREVISAHGQLMGNTGALVDGQDVALFELDTQTVQVTSLDDVAIGSIVPASLAVKGREALPLTTAQVDWWACTLLSGIAELE